MSSKEKPSLVAPLGGVIVGIGVFLGVNLTIGHAVIPTAESVTNISHGLSAPKYLSEEVSAAPVGGTYQTVCITCHQAEGQGVPGAFPPLAGSEWILGTPEIPIRIVLLGLTGEIEVKGLKFKQIMPPPPGLGDEQIAEAITYARSHFGNKASEVDAALVKQVRESLAGRTTSWTAAELKALAPAPGEAAATGAPAEAAAAGAPAEAAPKGSQPEKVQP